MSDNQQNPPAGTSGAAPYIEEDEIDLLELIGVLFKYKWFIIITTAVATVGVVIFSILTIKLPPENNPLPNVYSPGAMILVNDSSSSGGLSSMIASSGLGDLAGLAGVSTGGGGYGILAEKLAVSKTILDVIIDEFDLVERYEIEEYIKYASREAVKENLSVAYDEETKTLNISFTDYDPEFAKKVVDRFIEELVTRFSTIGQNRNYSQKEMLERNLREVEFEIARLETDIKAFQTKYGVLDVETLAAEQITVLAELRSQLIMKEMEIKTYSAYSRLEDPVVQRLNTERDELQNLIQDIEEGTSSYSINQPAQKDMPDLYLEFEHMKRDMLVQGKIYELLTSQNEAIKLKLEGEAPIFQVLEYPEVPDKKSGPSRAVICAAVTAGAFFMAVIGAFVIHAFRNLRKDPERWAKITGKNLE